MAENVTIDKDIDKPLSDKARVRYASLLAGAIGGASTTTELLAGFEEALQGSTSDPFRDLRRPIRFSALAGLEDPKVVISPERKRALLKAAADAPSRWKILGDVVTWAAKTAAAAGKAGLL